MLRRRLRNYIERILDENSQQNLDVIVQARRPDAQIRSIATQAALAMRERMYSRSARELTPPSKSKQDALSRMSLAEVKADIVNMRSSMVARSALAQSQGQSREAISRAGDDAIEKVLKETPLSKAAEKALASGRTLSKLRIANSVVARLDRNELAALRAEDQAIESVFPNLRIKLPTYARGASLPTTVTDNRTSAYGIDATGAMSVWGAYGSRGQGIKVAVLDSGIDPHHPDLAGKIAGFAEFDENGNEIPDASPHDTDDHGTHVAGTIVGGDASGSYIGMAPDANVLAGLVLPGGSGTIAQIIGGMEWAVEQGADVINMSLGSLTTEAEVPSAFTLAIVNSLLAGVPVVVAIGNDGAQTTGDPGNDLFAFAVGASDTSDKIAGFSGGRTHLITESDFIDPEALPLPYMKPDISAPGVEIMSSIPGEEEYAPSSGTSMAAPHVAGAIALLLGNTSIRDQSSGPDRTFLIRDLLTSSVEELGENGQDQRFGFGRLNILRAIGMARELGFAPTGNV